MSLFHRCSAPLSSQVAYPNDTHSSLIASLRGLVGCREESNFRPITSCDRARQPLNLQIAEIFVFPNFSRSEPPCSSSAGTLFSSRQHGFRRQDDARKTTAHTSS